MSNLKVVSNSLVFDACDVIYLLSILIISIYMIHYDVTVFNN